MKITCQACQAKYTIADEKVVGKVVKIRCKKCGATIVVNGNETSIGSQPPGAGEDGGEAALALTGTASEPWTVNVGEGDQRVMLEPELVAAYRAGVVTNDTYCWRDGMPDWAPIAELGPLYAACTAPGAAAGEFPAKGQDTSAAGVPTRTSTPPAGPHRASTSPKDRNGAPAATSATAARRAGGRAAAADLFRGAAQAGGEDEVMTSAPPSLPAPGAGAHASASKETGASAPSMTATTEASGLIDIRQLGQQMRPAADERKKTRVDDIMNIGGGAGGGFGPSLAAPVLTAPSLEHYSQPPPGLLAGPVASQVKSRALMIVAVSAGIFFLVAAVGVIVLIVRGTGPGEERDRASTGSTTAAAGSTGASAGTGSATGAASAEAPPGRVRARGRGGERCACRVGQRGIVGERRQREPPGGRPRGGRHGAEALRGPRRAQGSSRGRRRRRGVQPRRGARASRRHRRRRADLQARGHVRRGQSRDHLRAERRRAVGDPPRRLAVRRDADGQVRRGALSPGPGAAVRGESDDGDQELHHQLIGRRLSSLLVGLWVGVGFLLGLRVGLAVGSRAERRRAGGGTFLMRP